MNASSTHIFAFTTKTFESLYPPHMIGEMDREKDKLRRARAARAAQLLEVRAKAALQARHDAINAASSRASAALAATASRESLLRDLFQQRLAHEKTMERARTERTFHRGLGPKMPSPTQHENHRSVSSDADHIECDQQERKGIHHAAEAAYHAAAAEARAQEARVQDARASERCRRFEQDAARRSRLHSRSCMMYLPSLLPEAAKIGDEQVLALPIDTLVLHMLRHQGCAHRCLGVTPNAPAQTVRKRYLALARRLHPDKTDHPSAAQAFAALEAAFHGMDFRI